MKRLLPLALLLCAVACTPEIYTHHLQMRHASRSGLNLSGKSMAIVYLDGGNAADTTLMKAVASGLANTMEAEYFGGEEFIDIFSVPNAEVDLEFAHSLVMDTGADVVFILTPPETGEITLGENIASGILSSPDSTFVINATVPVKLHLSAYDSMGKEDKLHAFGGSTSVDVAVYNNGLTGEAALIDRVWESIETTGIRLGEKASTQFVPTWENESYSFYYYGFDSWEKATVAAAKLEWKKAIENWIPLLKTGDLDKRSCLEYNLALGAYMLGDCELALKWLDRADADNASNSLSPGLRKRITERINEK